MPPLRLIVIRARAMSAVPLPFGSVTVVPFAVAGARGSALTRFGSSSEIVVSPPVAG